MCLPASGQSDRLIAAGGAGAVASGFEQSEGMMTTHMQLYRRTFYRKRCGLGIGDRVGES